MKYKQFIENYKDNYKKYKGWKVKKTESYIFYYFDNDFIKKDINKIINTQQKSYNKILTILNINYNKKIKYYIYPNTKTKASLMGNHVYAQSIYSDNSIHIIYNKNIQPLGPHEDTHLMSLKLGLPTSFFAEGLAEYIANRRKFNGEERSLYVKKWLKKYNKDEISNFFAQKSWLNTSDKESGEFYTISMYFVKFLIKLYGKDNFIKFYKKVKREMTSRQIEILMSQVFNIEYKNIIKEWKIK